MSHPDHFVADGHERAREALSQIIRAEVEDEYAERLEEASVAERLLLRLAMRREIERRVQLKAPMDALY